MVNILPGQVGVFSVIGVDSAGNPELVTGTVKVSDYVSAYVAPTPNLNEYMLVPKVTIPVGQSVSVSATFSAVASDGSKLADFAVQFVLQGATPPPPAVQMILKSATAVPASSVTVPPDPGSDTIAINSVALPPPPPPPPGTATTKLAQVPR